MMMMILTMRPDSIVDFDAI